MADLDALKNEAEKLKKLKEEACAALGKKYVTKAELEAFKIKKIKEEEQRQREAKVSGCCVRSKTSSAQSSLSTGSLGSAPIPARTRAPVVRA